MEQQHVVEDMDTPAYLENPGGDAITRIQMSQHLQLGCLDHPDLQAVRDEPFQQRGVLDDDLFEPPLAVPVAVGDAEAPERLGAGSWASSGRQWNGGKWKRGSGFEEDLKRSSLSNDFPSVELAGDRDSGASGLAGT
jgi:hypothetical protein